MSSSLIDLPVVLRDKHGDKFTLSPASEGKYHEALRVLSPYFCVLDILDDKDQKVGVINYYLEAPNWESVYLNWVGLSKTVRGLGYVVAMAEYANAFFADAGVKRLILAVPEDAEHVYASFGFEKDETVESRNGLIQMNRNFD